MISVNNLKKEFESTVAVDNISFSTDSGKIFGLLGPNGAGKSTTIKILMNILSRDGGEVLFNGSPITKEHRDLIGYLPEERGIYKKLKVKDFILYLGTLKGGKKEVLEKNIDYWLDFFSLSDWKDKKAETLSKGMSQKIQFIASIVHNPDIVILDEPFSGLDPVSTERLREAILKLNNEGKTIIFSTHIMEQAEKICSDILIINRGKEVVKGNVSDIKERFGHRTIALEFEGDGKFIKGMDEVKRVIEYPRFIEVELRDEKDSDEFLKKVCDKVSVKRFEKLVPSLHKIFLDTVGEIDE